MDLFGKFTLPDLVALFGILGVANTLFWAYLRSQYVPRSYLFCPKDGTPIYRTIEECIKLEEKKEMDRKDTEKRIEKSIDNKFKEIKEDNKQFVKNLKGLFETQTRELSDTIKSVVRP